MPDPLDVQLAHLAEDLGRALERQRARLVTAESCTGGLVAGAITAIAGSSSWFERGFVTYANQAKIDLLGVPGELIEQHGAVSEACAKAMAEGALAHSDSDLAVAITGIAGPDGGTAQKPVGTVCFGFARRGGVTRVVTTRFPGDRSAVRQQAVAYALTGALEYLAQPLHA